MESLERLSGGATSNHVHHGGLNLDEITLSEEVAQKVKNLVPRCEDILDLVVHDKIEVTLAVPGVLVENFRLALPLGKHMHAVRETNDLGGSN